MKANLPIAIVPQEVRERYCRIGQGAAICRYLTCGPRGFECEKHTDLRHVLDHRAGLGLMTARGDNCSGVVPKYAVEVTP